MMETGSSVFAMQTGSRYQPTFAERYPVIMLAAVLDWLLVLAAVYCAYRLRFGHWELPSLYLTAALVVSVVVMISLWGFGLYGSWRGRSYFAQLWGLLLGWVIAIGVLLSIAFFLKTSEDYSRQWFIYFVSIGLGMTALSRFSVFLFLRQLRSAGRNLKSVVVVELEAGSSFANEVTLREEGYRVAGRLPYRQGEEWLDSLTEMVEGEGAHEVWLCLPLAEGGSIKSVMYALRHHTVAVRFMPAWNDLPVLNHKVSSIAGVYSLDLSCSPMDGPARLVKRIEDVVIGGLITLLILPVYLVIAVAIKLSSPGPVMFKQYRTGINGKKFKVYKFRSMVVHQEGAGGITQAKREDPRITRIGAFLRRTSLDELPQFFNVLQGRMSIVGPRPHALAHNEYYKDLVESYMQRHKVKPGITGWAQVNGYRGETDTLDKMQKRVECDLWYIDNWSLWLDIKIIFWTVFKGFIGKTAY